MDATLLEQPFSETEIWHAINHYEGSKALGPDGFNMKFIKKCWAFIKADICIFLNEFHQNSRIKKGLNSTFLTLIPKILNPSSLFDYRPINSSKILSRRLKSVLPKLIDETQSTFVKRRQILDGILVANEVVDLWKHNSSGGLFLKLDF
ncbi:hypothetical protein ACSBR1_035924 [Camellia fascicularis]